MTKFSDRRCELLAAYLAEFKILISIWNSFNNLWVTTLVDRKINYRLKILLKKNSKESQNFKNS